MNNLITLIDKDSELHGFNWIKDNINGDFILPNLDAWVVIEVRGVQLSAVWVVAQLPAFWRTFRKEQRSLILSLEAETDFEVQQLLEASESDDLVHEMEGTGIEHLTQDELLEVKKYLEDSTPRFSDFFKEEDLELEKFEIDENECVTQK